MDIGKFWRFVYILRLLSRTVFRSLTDNLSSDEETGASSQHNGFVYSIDADAIGYEHDLEYENDVKRYGEAYARYKSRIFKKNRTTVDSENDDDDDEDGDQTENSLKSDASLVADDYYSD